MKRALAVLLAVVLLVGLIPTAAAATFLDEEGKYHYEPEEQGVYSNGGYYIDKISHPTLGAGEVDGILTGWHEPEASHLLMLEAIAAPGALETAYAAALDERYLWHEFGDVHILVNQR